MKSIRSKVLFLALSLVFFQFNVEASVLEKISITRPDQSDLEGYFNAPNKDSFPIVLFIEGIQCESVKSKQEKYSDPMNNLGLGLMSLEKRGIYSPDEIDLIEYDQHNFREFRVEDQLICIQKLREGLIPGWNGQLIIIGASEGGSLAGTIAARTPEVVAMMIFASGGGMSTRDEIKCVARRYLEKTGTTEESIEEILASADGKFDEIIANPVPDQTFFGFSYRWWASRLKPNNFLEDVLSLRCPIYYAHGTEDEFVPIESADLLVLEFRKRGKRNLTYNRMDGYGHDLYQPPRDAFYDAFLWLNSVLK